MDTARSPAFLPASMDPAGELVDVDLAVKGSSGPVDALAVTNAFIRELEDGLADRGY